MMAHNQHDAGTSFLNPIRRPSTNSVMSSEVHSEPDLSMMGTTLMGGSNWLPTPLEREKYDSGIEIRAKYVGAIEVPEARGMAMLTTAISRVRAQHKLSKEKKPKMRFVISTTGLRVYDEQTQMLRDTYDINCISYIGILPANKKVFAFITANDLRLAKRVHTCHVFKTNKKTSKIQETIGRYGMIIIPTFYFVVSRSSRDIYFCVYSLMINDYVSL